MVEHRNVVNVVTWFGRRYGLADKRHVLQISDYVFDPSVEQVLGTLIFGSTVCLIRREWIMDKERFRWFINIHQIDMINFVPGTLKELLTGQGKLKSLKTVISGGDRLDDIIKDELLREGYRLYNHYGPTEITVDALSTRCSLEERVHLGKPIANTRVYVLDRFYSLVPMGVPGELCIAGDGLARGYLNNPELTAEKFDHDGYHRSYRSYIPYMSYIYRTGDLARWLPYGNIEFLGRIDNQVKIRGLRVEPGEIENQLLALEGINEAVVVMKANEKGDKHLFAYFTGDRPFDVSELKKFLLKKLPLYMVPTGFVQLEYLPGTAAGKVDIQALPESGIQTAEVYEAPGNEIEKQLVHIWSEILALDEEKIGINTSFFDLGGQSILAMKLLSAIRETFQAKLPLAAFFQVGTVKGIAGLILESHSNKEKKETKEDFSLSGIKFEKRKRREKEMQK
jgi:acyl-coenzyme A synthetase/AMP-(fatty) acid ligase/acyl carrier protein